MKVLSFNNKIVTFNNKVTTFQFNPSKIEDSFYWLDFTDTTKITTVDGKISYVSDSLGNWDFNQPIVSERPVYNTTGDTHNYMQLSEGPHIISKDIVDMPETNEFSVWVIGKLYDDTDGNGGIILETSDNTNNYTDSLLCSLNSTTQNRVLATYRDGTYSQTGVGYNSEFGKLNFIVFVFKKDNINLSSRTKVYINDELGTQNNIIVNDTGISNWGNYNHYIGERSGDVAELFADIYEMGTIGRSLGLDEVEYFFNNYTNPKYNIK